MMKISEAEQDAQFKLAAAIMDPAFQESFNLKKGSIPARNDVPDTNFDACGKKAIADAKEATANGSLMGSMAHGHAAPEAVKGAVYDVVTEFFNSDMSSADASKKLAAGGRQREVERTAGAPASRRPDPTAGEVADGDRRRQRLRRGPCRRTGWPSICRSSCWRRPSSSRCSSSTASSCGRPSCRSPSRASCRSCSSTGCAPTSGCGPTRTGGPRSRTLRSSASSTSASPPRSASCWRSCSTRRSAARACCARSTSTRWRSRSSSPARPGSGCSIPASASRRSCSDWGFTSFTLDWIVAAQHRDLLHRHRRDLAVQRLRHGDVPGRPARRRRRDRQGGADRRRLDLQDLLADHHPADAAGVPVRRSSSSRTSRSRATT